MQQKKTCYLILSPKITVLYVCMDCVYNFENHHFRIIHQHHLHSNNRGNNKKSWINVCESDLRIFDSFDFEMLDKV